MISSRGAIYKENNSLDWSLLEGAVSRYLSLSMGISDEIEDAIIAIDETTILKIEATI